MKEVSSKEFIQIELYVLNSLPIEEAENMIAFNDMEFDMAIELARVGMVLNDISFDNNGNYHYSGTLPFNFGIYDSSNKLYTHHTAAVESKEIIRKYLHKGLLDKYKDDNGNNPNVDDFTLSYTMRDYDEDLWTEDTAQKYIDAVKEMKDNFTKFSTEYIEKRRRKENVKKD